MEAATKATDDAPLQPEPEPMVDETMAEVEAGLRQEITVTIDEQAAVQKMRAEASVLGERLGLGNMQVKMGEIEKGRDGPKKKRVVYIHGRYSLYGYAETREHVIPSAQSCSWSGLLYSYVYTFNT